VLLHYLGKQQTRQLIAPVHVGLMLHAALPKKHMKHIECHYGHCQNLTVCSRQDLGRECSILQYVTLALNVYRVCQCVGLCVENGSCSYQAVKVNGQCCWDILSQQISDAIKPVNDDNFVFQPGPILAYIIIQSMCY